MAIYIRGDDGEIQALEIPAYKGEKGDKGDSGVFVGDISEAPETAEIIVDDSDLGLTYLNEELIDDTTLSTEKTWSSSKIEDFVLNNDNTVWLDQSGENPKVDSTKEGYLREVEIWGNTIQNEEDLSDIQHLGELYVDDEGQPILDELGREQYKIEIESANNRNLIDTNPNSWKIDETTNNRMIQINPIKVEPSTLYTFAHSQYVWGFIFECDSNGQNMKQVIGNNGTGGQFVTSPNCEYVISRFDVFTNMNYPHQYQFRLFKGSVDLGYDGYVDNRQFHKTTILLPCQLMKVGDVADRLYWDNEKGKYVVEKNVFDVEISQSDISDVNSTWFEGSNLSVPYGEIIITPLKSFNVGYTNTNKVGCLSSKYKSITKDARKTVESESVFLNDGVGRIGFVLSKSNLGESPTTQQVKDYIFKEEDTLRIVTLYSAPQLIETNIAEQIKLPTYLNTTYIIVNGGIQGSIKVKAPVDGSAVVNSLVQANYELKQENEEIKAINEEQDQVINISLMATDEIFMMLEPLLDIATLSNENATSKIVDMYRVMVAKGLKKIEEVPERYKAKLTKDGE